MTLTEAHKRLKEAKAPEDIFDGVKSADDLKKAYREWAKVVHPDGKSGRMQKQADEAFKLLNEKHEEAEAKLAAGTYGNRLAMGKTVTLKTKKDEYELYGRLPVGALCNVYLGLNKADEDVVVKVVRSPANNDLLENEQTMLRFLCEDAPTKHVKAMCHIPTITDSFLLSSGGAKKRVNVMPFYKTYVSIKEVMDAKPEGFDIRDTAWMFNRLMGALLVTSQAGVVHGAVLPEHIIVEPDNHNAILLDWCYSTKEGGKVKAMVKSRADYYPPEIVKGDVVNHTADLYMAAKLMMALTSKESMPRNIAGLLKTCFLARQNRPTDVYAFFQEFGAELKLAVGERKYRRFINPVKK